MRLLLGKASVAEGKGFCDSVSICLLEVSLSECTL